MKSSLELRSEIYTNWFNELIDETNPTTGILRGTKPSIICLLRRQPTTRSQVEIEEKRHNIYFYIPKSIVYYPKQEF